MTQQVSRSIKFLGAVIIKAARRPSAHLPLGSPKKSKRSADERIHSVLGLKSFDWIPPIKKHDAFGGRSCGCVRTYWGAGPLAPIHILSLNETVDLAGKSLSSRQFAGTTLRVMD
jgi:hypothetical protein